jgi:hypothetical protein
MPAMPLSPNHVTVEEWTVWFEIAPNSTVIMDTHTVNMILEAGLRELGLHEIKVSEVEYKDTSTP